MAGKVMARDPGTGKFRWMARDEAEAGGLEIKEAFGGRFGNRTKPKNPNVSRETSSSGAAAGGMTARPQPPRAAANRGPRARGDVAALGNLAWGFLSLPLGIVSPSAGSIMRMQTAAKPSAGQQIDTLLKGTALYDALTSSGNSDKAMAAFYLAAPILLSVVGDQAWSRLEDDPGNVRARMMVSWLRGMTEQVLESQGIAVPPAPQPPAAEARSAPAYPPPPPPPPPPEPSSVNGNGQVHDVAAVAAAAAEASRFDAVE